MTPFVTVVVYLLLFVALVRLTTRRHSDRVADRIIHDYFSGAEE